MEKRTLGRTGLEVSVLTFGCGAVGGLMTKGAAADQDRAVAWAVDHGINHFDTAPLYGNGASERNLGRALKNIGSDVVVSTKVRLDDVARADVPGFIERSMEDSLRRLGRDHVDLIQLHNTVAGQGDGTTFGVDDILSEVVPAFEKLKTAGKARFLGFTANGETAALHGLVESRCFDAAQVFFNILTPSAARTQPAGYPGQDYERLLDKAAAFGVGTIGVRVLAGGAMAGHNERHHLGMPHVDPIGSGASYAEDAARALHFGELIEAGEADSLPELALRYAVGHERLTTTEIGIATLDEFQTAVAAVERGALSSAAMERIAAVQAGFANG